MKILTLIIEWASDRYPVKPAWTRISHHVRKPVPAHTNFLFTLGSLAIFLFAIQVVTGLLMMVYYKPSVRDAYASVLFITEEVPFGWLIRQVHTWGANLMVLVVLLHMLKTFIYGGYKRPREMTWVLGVMLFGIVLGFGFTGYLLPWDQLAFWATTVATEAPGSMPFAGPFIAELMRGGPEVGEATLGRFFVAHVALLPIALLGVMALHLLLVRLQGTSPLERTDVPEPTSEEKLQAGGKPFFPHHMITEGIAAYLILGILLTLAILAPFHLAEPANPFETPVGIKPEWYFLPMFQLLKYLPEPVAVALPGIFGLVLLLLPFIDRSVERHPKKRPVAMALGAAVLVITLTLGILGKVSETNLTLFGSDYHFDAKGIPHLIEKDGGPGQ
jgi:ubiquinol-cytochrome c reductase cytochrome b subunit